jgi:peptide deformylase
MIRNDMTMTDTDDTRLLEIGDPRLRERSAPVADFSDPELPRQDARLHRWLSAFRAEHGFGRAIAAPQIGIARRFIALNLPHWSAQPFTMYNPEITWRSTQRFELWDDCMSFPFMLVRVRRHASISVRYQTETGESIVRERLDRSDSELLQHEIDHLDGVLAVDRATEENAIVSRRTFEADPDYFAAQVARSNASDD